MKTKADYDGLRLLRIQTAGPTPVDVICEERKARGFLREWTLGSLKNVVGEPDHPDGPWAVEADAIVSVQVLAFSDEQKEEMARAANELEARRQGQGQLPSGPPQGRPSWMLGGSGLN